MEFKAIYVMWKRQLKRFSRNRARMVVSLFQPIMFLVAFGFGFGPMFDENGLSYLQFLAPGIITMTILFGSVMNGAETIMDKQFGFLKETLVAPVSRNSIMLGKTLGGATIAVLQGFLIFGLTLMLGFEVYDWALVIPAILVMFAVAMFYTSLGIALASKVDDMQAFPMIMNFFIMPTFFLSGALFPLANLPSALEFLTRFNPLVYGVDAIRGLLTGYYVIGIWVDLIVLVPLIIGMIILGAWSFSKIEA